MVSNIKNKSCHTLWTGTVLRQFFLPRVILHSTLDRNENTAPSSPGCRPYAMEGDIETK